MRWLIGLLVLAIIPVVFQIVESPYYGHGQLQFSGGQLVTAGTCESLTLDSTWAKMGVPVILAPRSDLPSSFFWYGFVSSSGIVRINVCALRTDKLPQVDFHICAFRP